MNQETIQAINELGKSTCDHIVKNEINTSILTLGLCSFVIFAMLIFVYHMLKSYSDEGFWWEYDIEMETIFIVFGIISLAMIIVIVYEAFDIINAYSFPEEVIKRYLEINK